MNESVLTAKTRDELFRLVLEVPDLRKRILEKSTGVIGEFLVSQKIASLGYTVKPASTNRPQSDLLVMSPAGVEFSVEVKSDRSARPTWFARKRPDPKASKFWVLGALILDPAKTEYFVLTVDEAQAIWDGSEYNRKNPENCDLRRWQIPDEAREAWHKFPS